MLESSHKGLYVCTLYEICDVIFDESACNLRVTRLTFLLGGLEHTVQQKVHKVKITQHVHT